MATKLLDRLTNPVVDDRTQFIIHTARAIVLARPNAASSDEGNVIRAMCACELWGLNQYFSLAPRSVGMFHSELLQVVKLIRQGML